MAHDSHRKILEKSVLPKPENGKTELSNNVIVN